MNGIPIFVNGKDYYDREEAHAAWSEARYR